MSEQTLPPGYMTIDDFVEEMGLVFTEQEREDARRWVVETLRRKDAIRPFHSQDFQLDKTTA